MFHRQQWHMSPLCLILRTILVSSQTRLTSDATSRAVCMKSKDLAALGLNNSVTVTAVLQPPSECKRQSMFSRGFGHRLTRRTPCSLPSDRSQRWIRSWCRRHPSLGMRHCNTNLRSTRPPWIFDLFSVKSASTWTMNQLLSYASYSCIHFGTCSRHHDSFLWMYLTDCICHIHCSFRSFVWGVPTTGFRWLGPVKRGKGFRKQ